MAQFPESSFPPPDAEKPPDDISQPPLDTTLQEKEPASSQTTTSATTSRDISGQHPEIETANPPTLHKE
jgi:hypothetical protein